MNPIRSLDVVIPVYNEEGGLPVLLDRLRTDLPALGKRWRVVLVDDGSRDRSWELISEAALTDEHFHAVRLSRNYGQHAAVFAGLSVCDADAVLTMDADLQTPPSEAPKLLAALEEGHDVAGGWRRSRKDRFHRKFFSRLMNRLVSRATGLNLKDYGCMFRAYRIEVVRRMCEAGGLSTYIPTLAMSYTDRIAEIPVEHGERHEGESKYSFLKLMNLLMDLLTSSSMLPLRLLSFIGVLLAMAGGLAAVLLIVLRLVFGPEWAVGGVFTLFAVLFFFVGAQFLAFGILGEYVGRIYNEVRRRPTFTIREQVGAAAGRDS